MDFSQRENPAMLLSSGSYGQHVPPLSPCLLRPLPLNPHLWGALNSSSKWLPCAPTNRDSFSLCMGRKWDRNLAKLWVIPPCPRPKESRFSKIFLPEYTFYKLSGEHLVKYAFKILRNVRGACLRDPMFFIIICLLVYFSLFSHQSVLPSRENLTTFGLGITHFCPPNCYRSEKSAS